MVRRKTAAAEAANVPTRSSSRKQARNQDVGDTPKDTPVKRRRGRPTNYSSKADIVVNEGKSAYDIPSSDESEDTQQNHEPSAGSATPSGRKRRGEYSTPRVTRTNGRLKAETPRWRRNDRSARKKSARALIERVVAGSASDKDDDQDIAREIFESSDEDEDEDDDDEDQEGAGQDRNEQETPAATPSKKARRRSKTATRARKKSPTPPRDLPPHELYFAQNRRGTSKTSNHNLANLQLLTHEEYFSVLHAYKDPHAEDIDFLQSLHAESFPQWAFELSQNLGVCLYGYGSKRPLLHKFAKYMYNNRISEHDVPKIVIINGYVRNTSVRELLGTVGSAVDASYKPPAGNPSAILDSVKSLLSLHRVTMIIILNSIDALPLRKSGIQTILAQLASHPHVQFVCSADTPDFSLLWDSGLRSAFNFAFHDCTTFASFTAEIDVVDDVHELLGRKARRVGGKEGVTYVLRSLPENAKNLFRLLVSEVLALMDDDGISAGENPGVEYRILYVKAVEEFICSSEMAFRTLLKEFHDHQMIISRKDLLGTELLSVPFRKEEQEAILEDLMS